MFERFGFFKKVAIVFLKLRNIVAVDTEKNDQLTVSIKYVKIKISDALSYSVVDLYRRIDWGIQTPKNHIGMMSQSNPDKLAKNAGGTCNLAMHFHAKNETLTEVYTDEAINDSNAIRQGSEDNEKGRKEFDLPTDSELKSDKMPGNTETLGSHSPSPSEYRKIFKNFNEFTEKITKTVEEKISEIKSDLNTSRSRILSSKENSSLSDSEENSESSRIFDLKSFTEDSPRKSLSLDIPQSTGITGKVEPEFEFFEVGSELRQRKKTWPPEVTKFTEELSSHDLTFDENIEIESAVEAYETTNVDESDEESQYFDAADFTITADDAGGEPPKEEEIFKFLRFVNNPENKKLKGYAAFLTFCLFVLPMPSFIRGFLTCLLIVVFWCLLNNYVRSLTESHPSLPTTPFCIPDYSKLSPLKVPRILQEEGVLFNEYTQPYDPDWYSVSQTIPVYLEIENSYLKLSRPKGKISKRATCDEKTYKLEFLNQRIYDLRYCRISLKPEGLLRRRFFSKKYPIVIELGPGSLVKAVKYKESPGEEETDIDIESTYKGTDSGGGKSPYGREYLNLFARCNRQKEEWFRRLKVASKNQATKVNEVASDDSTPFENLKFDPEMADYDEYWQYMIKFVGDVRYDTPILKTYILQKMKSGRYKVGRKKKDIPANENIQPDMKKKTLHLVHSTKDGVIEEEESGPVLKSALEVQWLNAFINRFLYDIFRTPYWLNKIQAKIQRKLAAIRLPYYVEAVEVIELNLGKVGPRFHRISAPVLDERGLWIDMDLTFDGSFKMILQTQLNLIKLQKGLEDEVEKLPDEKQETRPVRGKKVEVTSNSFKKVNDKSSAKELLMEFAEIVVSDNTVLEKDQGSVNTVDVDNSDSTESDEDDEDEDYRTETTSNNLTIGQNEAANEARKPPARRSSKRIFRVMESVAQSKYFKTIAETKYVQKAIAGVSATKLRLTLEVKSCVGTLSVNVPPPPNDRIWYGFRNVPKLWMSAQPKVGQRNIRFSHIKHFLERKILEEVKKLVVMPNMDDLLIPIPPDDLVSRIVSMTGVEMECS